MGDPLSLLTFKEFSLDYMLPACGAMNYGEVIMGSSSRLCGNHSITINHLEIYSIYTSKKAQGVINSPEDCKDLLKGPEEAQQV